MKARDLVGRRVTIIVHRTPCRCSILGSDFDLLTTSTSGRIERFIDAPNGALGILSADDGRRILFDAASDIHLGKIEIEVSDDA